MGSGFMSVGCRAHAPHLLPLQVSDVDLAAASGGLVLGFNLSPDNVVEEHAKRLGVKLMTYKVGANLG